MKRNIFNFVTILLIIGGFSSCSEKEEDASIVTGTVIGSYSNGWYSLLVQVDKKYPIGEILECVETPENYCTKMPKAGTYRNMIEVQPFLPLSGLLETETVIGKRISFSYRKYQSEDQDLFLFGPGNAMCIPPAIPKYVIIDCKIIK